MIIIENRNPRCLVVVVEIKTCLAHIFLLECLLGWNLPFRRLVIWVEVRKVCLVEHALNMRTWLLYTLLVLNVRLNQLGLYSVYLNLILLDTWQVLLAEVYSASSDSRLGFDSLVVVCEFVQVLLRDKEVLLSESGADDVITRSTDHFLFALFLHPDCHCYWLLLLVLRKL